MPIEEDDVSTRPNHEMSRRVDNALESLPRDGAAPGFTARVVSELEARTCSSRVTEGGSGLTRGARLATAGALFALLVSGLVLRWSPPTDRNAAVSSQTARAQALRGELRSLQTELQEIRKTLEVEATPILLASDRGVDVVVDVAALAALSRAELRPGLGATGPTHANEENRDAPQR